MKKVLIANRGEIAVRVIRACRDYGVKSVAIYAECDMEAPYAKLADEAYSLGDGMPIDTYLDIKKIMDIAKKTKADAIHPGYGFLSERSDFARAVLDAGIKWIGPSPEVIDKLGDKVEARHIAKSVGAPLVAGSDGPVNSHEEILAFAKEHGYPVAIKAAFGGGGRGLKVAWRAEDVEELFSSAVREATAAFGRGECYVEQFLDRPRHVEAQVMADNHGHVVVIGTRDCSLQRRNQKLIEEAPAPFLTAAQRDNIHTAAAAICKKAGYSGAGTVEFLLGSNGVISFLEVNTRLQVEHPVTEETTGIDLVIQQLRVADGKPLSITKTPEPTGHSIEFRINAEDASLGFLPTPGQITLFKMPAGPGVRVDSGVEQGGAVAPMFDSMMAKLIVTGPNREIALRRARRALKEFEIEGVASVLPFHRAVLEQDDFISDKDFRVHTRWIETDFHDALDAYVRADPVSHNIIHSTIEIDGKRVVIGLPPSFLRQFGSLNATPQPQAVEEQADEGAVLAPVPGSIRTWSVKEGDKVKQGDSLGLMEAMKMETPIIAPRDGRIHILADANSTQSMGAVIARIE